MNPFSDLLAGLGVGLASGASSGLLGISPGGGLVVFEILLLGCEQHVAQGISLIAQIPPTSISGIQRYWDRGSQSPIRWLFILAIGFLTGGAVGALAAGTVSGDVLRYTYVFYLAALDLLLILRPPARHSENARDVGLTRDLHWVALLAVGAVAGLSSGFLGIGGGLATTVSLSAGLKVPQHQAQAISLALSMIPLTIPAAWVYSHQGWSIPWFVVAGVVLGLWAGTDFGARMATRVGGAMLRRILIGLVSVMTVYMAYKALT
jgi:uncharacterized membrane protein YfcA